MNGVALLGIFAVEAEVEIGEVVGMGSEAEAVAMGSEVEKDLEVEAIRLEVSI